MTYEFHRNGISGWPFWVKSDKYDTVVVFSGEQDDDGPNSGERPFRLSHVRLQEGLKVMRTAKMPYWIIRVTDRTGIVLFNDAEITHVAITDLEGQSDSRIAVFDADKLPDVRFGYNSWRGDNHQVRVNDILRRPW